MISRTVHFARTIAGLVFRRPLVSVVVIGTDENGRIALARRRDTGLWSLPGGLVDWGETVAACGARELQEEVGLEVVDFVRVVGVYSEIDRDPRIHAVAVVLSARVVGEIRAADPREVVEARMAGLSSIEDEIGFDNLAFDNGRHLRDFIAGGDATLA